MQAVIKILYGVGFVVVFVCAFMAVAFQDWRRDLGLAVGCLIAALLLHQLTLRKTP